MVFIDSSAFIAAFDRREARHQAAAEAWEQLARSRERFVTTGIVFAEVVTLLRRRGGHAPARRAGEAIRNSPAIEIVHPDAEQFGAAWREFLRLPRAGLSLADGLSFAIMRERGIERAFTFDDDFAAAGFVVVP